MVNRKKLTLLLIAILTMLCVVTACQGSQEPLPENYDTEALDTASQLILAHLYEENYGGVEAMVRQDLQKDLSAEVLQKAWEQTGAKMGEPVETVRTNYSGQDDGAVVQLDQKYEKGTLRFTFAFDKDYKLTGLWIK